MMQFVVLCSGCEKQGRGSERVRNVERRRVRTWPGAGRRLNAVSSDDQMCVYAALLLVLPIVCRRHASRVSERVERHALLQSRGLVVRRHEVLALAAHAVQRGGRSG